MNRPASIGVVIPWWGPPPPYIDLTLRTMRANPDITWLIFSDDTFPPLPENVLHYVVSFSDFVARVQQQFDFPIALTRPYKLCDFRPAFGEILADEFAQFDYWGHADLDLLYGRVRAHLDPGLSAGASKLLVRGCFALYRNDAQVNSWYRRSSVPGLDYRDAFSASEPRHFDEWSGIYRILQAEGIPIWGGNSEVFDIDFRRLRPIAHHHAGTNPVYVWDRGRLIEASRNGTREGLAIHLQKRRMCQPDEAIMMAPRFFIGADRFLVTPPSWRHHLFAAPGFYKRHLEMKIRNISPAPLRRRSRRPSPPSAYSAASRDRR